MPPLRQRGRDIVLLAEHFVERFAVQYGRPRKRLHQDTIAWLLAHDWPGNVRELQNLILREFLLADGDLLCFPSKPRKVTSRGQDSELDLEQPFKSAKAKAVSTFERIYLDHLLTKTSGNISLAARLSGTDRSALNKLVKKHGLIGERFRTPSR
jgi:DNA-binding NtrC family response regulator